MSQQFSDTKILCIFSLLKSKNEIQPGFIEFKWVFFEIAYGPGEKKKGGGREERKERGKDEGQESSAIPEAEMGVC